MGNAEYMGVRTQLVAREDTETHSNRQAV